MDGVLAPFLWDTVIEVWNLHPSHVFFGCWSCTPSRVLSLLFSLLGYAHLQPTMMCDVNTSAQDRVLKNVVISTSMYTGCLSPNMVVELIQQRAVEEVVDVPPSACPGTSRRDGQRDSSRAGSRSAQYCREEPAGAPRANLEAHCGRTGGSTGLLKQGAAWNDGWEEGSRGESSPSWSDRPRGEDEGGQRGRNREKDGASASTHRGNGGGDPICASRANSGAEVIEVPAPQVMEEIVGVKHVPQERVQNNTVEQIVAVPVPHIREANHRHSPSRRFRRNSLG